MTTSTALLGSVETKQIKLGHGRIFLGTSGSSSFDGTAKFDTSSPGSAWEDLRCIGNNVTLTCNAGVFAYKNAVPSVTKKKFITGRDVTLTAEFDEFKSRVMQTSMGLLNPVNKLGSTEYVVQASPAPTATVFTLDSVSSLAAGDELVLASATGGLAASQNAGLISSITGLAVTLREACQTTPLSGWKAKERVSTKLVFGGSDVRTYPLLFVVDFVVDKKQFVVYFPNVSSAGTFNPNFGGGTQHAMIGITWDAYGVNDTDMADNALAIAYLFEDES